MKKYKLTIIWAAFCFLQQQANAQIEPSDTFSLPTKQAIRLGDQVPDSFYHIEHKAVNAKSLVPYDLTLKGYKDKLIILDFWATWCAPCIFSIKKIDSIKRAMNTDDFVIIPVTYHNAQTVNAFLKKAGLQLPSIILDSTLKSYFPHMGIPHQIWIRKQKVIAIPEWQYATAPNIRKAVKGEPLEMIMDIKDGLIDPMKPMFVTGNGDTGQSPYYRGDYSVIARRLPGFGQHGLTSLKVQDTSILYAYNLPIRGLFYEAFKTEISDNLDYKSGTIWEISDGLRKRLFEGPKKSITAGLKQDQLYDKWLNKNLYCYNLRYPNNSSGLQVTKIMQQDLNNFFGAYMNLEAKMETRRTRMAVLRLIGTKQESIVLLKTKGGKLDLDNAQQSNYYKYSNVTFSNIYPALDAINKDVVFADSTGITNLKVDFKLPKTIQNNPVLAEKLLKKYGLVVRIEEIGIPYLVIRERGLGSGD